MLQFNSKEGAINLILCSNEARVEQINVLYLDRLSNFRPRLKTCQQPALNGTIQVQKGAISLILCSNEARVEQIEVLHLGGL
jgi:hypothetical protein